MLREQLVNQAAAFGVRRPELRSLSGMGSPMLVGFLRPAILFPEGTLGRLSVSERTMVLGHELAHVKRGDLFWGLTASIVHALFFFHPLIWLGKQQLKLAQELPPMNSALTVNGAIQSATDSYWCRSLASSAPFRKLRHRRWKRWGRPKL